MAGPTAVRLDFQRDPGQRARVLNRVLFVVGAAMLAAAGAEYASVEGERAALQASAEQSSQARRSSGSLRGESRERGEGAAAAASAVTAQLAAPWADLFAAVEAAARDDVALLALQADPASGGVRLSGEARNFAALMAYVRRLKAAPALRDVILTGHEVRQHDPQRPVSFALSAKWEQKR